MKKRIIASVALGAALFALLGTLAGCGGAAPDKFAQFNAVVGKLTGAMEKFGADVTAAQDAKGVAAAIKSYIEGAKAAALEMKDLVAKYPELKVDPQGTPPKEIAEASQKLITTAFSMLGAAMKVQQYKDDPEVKAVYDEMQDIKITG